MTTKAGEKHITGKWRGGIVTAFSVAVGLALAATLIVCLNQNKDTAASFAEVESDQVCTDISADISASVAGQVALVQSTLVDKELADVLELEASSASRETVQKQLAPLLEQLVVDPAASSVFLMSASTDTIYTSGARGALSAETDGLRAWKGAGGSRGFGSGLGAYLLVQAPDGGSCAVLAARPLKQDGKPVGILGVCVSPDVLPRVMRVHEQEEGQHAALFSRDGTVLVSADDALPVGGNVFELNPALNGIRDSLASNEDGARQTWIGLGELLPKGQMLFTVKYCRDFDAFLLFTNGAQGIFDSMRAGSTTIVLTMTAVMALLLILAVCIVRWYRAQLMRATAIDELTNLSNRRSFITRYQRFAIRPDAGRASIALIDADYFKQINDTYGHAAGDEVLVAIADEVRALAGETGIAGRWGGDEFIAVMDEDPERAAQRVEAMIARIRDLDLSCGAKVSTSVGLAEIDYARTLEGNIEAADQALYASKEGGRGILSVYSPDMAPHGAGMPDKRAYANAYHARGALAGFSDAGFDEVVPDVHMASSRDDGGANAAKAPESNSASAVQAKDGHRDDEADGKAAGSSRWRREWDLAMKSLLYAVGKMIPFVAGGGVLIAIAFLVDAASVDVNALTADERASFGSITPIAAGLFSVGQAAFGFMLPIFAAFFARGLAGDHAFVAGFAGGYLASTGSSGFAGAILAAIVAAVIVRLMVDFLEEVPQLVRRIAPVLIYPVFSLLIMYLLMALLIDPVATAFDAALTAMLESLLPGSRAVLGGICAAMMATDMGGPINKAAYHFGTAAIAAGSPDIMAAVMVGGMVPPCGIAISMLIFRDKFTEIEHELTPSTFFLGLAFVTEGALPFLLTDILRVIPACMIGSGIAGVFSMTFGCTLMAPHGGIFVFPVVGQPILYLVALALGSLVTAVVLGLLKRPVQGERD